MIALPFTAVFLGPTSSLVTGVDFLNFAAVNEGLISAAFPGISNATRHMRAYSAMAWAVWRFEQDFETSGTRYAPTELEERFARFREKVEILFTWGNRGVDTGIVGSSRAFPEERSRLHRLTFRDLGTERVSWFDAATYGPSLKTSSGLGFIQPALGGTYRATPLGQQLAAALDKSIRRSDAYERLAAVADQSGNQAMATSLGKRWKIRESTPEERRVFQRALMEGDGGLADLRTMIEIVQAAVHDLDGRVASKDIREHIARAPIDSGTRSNRPQEARQRALWSVLQIRQLQRLATEAVLRWVELVLFRRPSELRSLRTIDLCRFFVEVACKGLEISEHESLSVLVQRVLVNADGRSDLLVVGRSRRAVDPLTQLNSLRELEGTDDEIESIPHTAVWCLLLAAIQARHMQEDTLFDDFLTYGGKDRLSLRTLVEIVSEHQRRQLADFLTLLVGTCTISQHMATAAARAEPGKNKFRFVPEDDGFRLLVQERQIQRLGVTPDRLDAALSLMADCALLVRSDDGRRFGPLIP